MTMTTPRGEPDHVKMRKSGLSTRDLHSLDIAVAALLGDVFPFATFLVGTAQIDREYRDVDVRTILSDDLFDEHFAHPELWSKWCFLVSDWLAHQTGLPVDYQVQRMTEANAKYDGPRNPIGNGRRGFAGYGDATPFDATGQHQTPKAAAPTKRPGNYPTGPRR